MSSRTVRPLWSRFVVYFGLTYVLLISLMGIAIERSSRAALVEDADEAMEVAASLATAALPASADGYEGWAADTFRLSGYRTTLIAADGVVLADSHLDPAGMENHSDREEVIEALAGDVGLSERRSASTGSSQRYLALPVRDDLIVRVSVAMRVIEEQLGSVRLTIVATAALIGLLGMVLAYILARRMARPLSELTDQALAVAEGDLDISPRGSNIAEFERLGHALSTMAGRLGGQLTEARAATDTMVVVLGALPQGTILVEPDDRVAYANPSAVDILGSVPDNLSSLAPFQLQASVRESRETGEQDVRTIDHGPPGGRLRIVSTPFSDDDRVLLLLIDVTVRERADSVRRDFVANASHELKTPVATIIAATEALRIALTKDHGSATGFADRIEASALQLDRLVNDLLDLSRLERDEPALIATRLDLLAREEVERVRDRAEEIGLDLVLELSEVVAMVSPSDVAIAVRNLLDNAIRHTSTGGTITIELSVSAGVAELAVGDTGEGIPTRDIERIFERFFRVDSARARATGGTGLGLAIAKHVAEGHGGSISVTSELGVGSTFTIRLPLDPSGEAPTAN